MLNMKFQREKRKDEKGRMEGEMMDVNVGKVETRKVNGGVEK